MLGAAFVLTQTFEQLADTFVLSIWPFYTLAIAGLYRLRYTQPHLARPYRVVGYPVTPAVFIVAGVGLIANARVGRAALDRASRSASCWREPGLLGVLSAVGDRPQAPGSGWLKPADTEGMFKKLFSKPKTAKHLVIARLNDRSQPMDRGERYEDPLEAFLKANGLGEVSGGGTQLLETGEIEYREVELQLTSTAPEVLAAVAEQLQSAGAPKGSCLVQPNGTEQPLGRQEGLAVYLNGTDLPDETYRDCDIDFVYSRVRPAAGGTGRGAQPLAGSHRNRPLHVRHVVRCHARCSVGLSCQRIRYVPARGREEGRLRPGARGPGSLEPL